MKRLNITTTNSKWKVISRKTDLELIALSTNTASQPRFFYELLHLFKQGCLSHHLTLLIGLKQKQKMKIF